MLHGSLESPNVFERSPNREHVGLTPWASDWSVLYKKGGAQWGDAADPEFLNFTVEQRAMEALH